MDKGYLPYLHNGKKFHTLLGGQCVYRYPKGDGVEIVKVSKELRRELFELDKREYNDDHREYRRRGELPTYDDTSAWEYVADESTYTLEDSICERMDTPKAINTLEKLHVRAFFFELYEDCFLALKTCFISTHDKKFAFYLYKIAEIIERPDFFIQEAKDLLKQHNGESFSC